MGVRDRNGDLMIKLTAPDGTHLTIDAKLVVRARRTVEAEAGEANPEARTRIDWATISFVRETIDKVAPLVKSELQSFTVLTSRDGSKIWFNAKQAVGPLPVTPSQQADGLKSCVKIGSFRQFFTETPEEVSKVISDAGGTPLAIDPTPGV
jgi:hypothetical protein